MKYKIITLNISRMPFYLMLIYFTNMGEPIQSLSNGHENSFISYNELHTNCIDSILSLNGFALVPTLSIKEAPKNIPPFSTQSNEALGVTKLLHTSRSGITKELKAEDILRKLARAIDIQEDELQLFWFTGIECENINAAFPKINTSRALAMYFNFERRSVYLKSVFGANAPF